MRNFIDSLKARKAASENESGFSLIDVVVTVAIIVALSVGGFVAYSGIIDTAKTAAVGSAADQVRTAMVVADNDGIASTTHDTVIAAFNTNSNGVKVAETDTTGKVTPGGGFVSAYGDETKTGTGTSTGVTDAKYSKILKVA